MSLFYMYWAASVVVLLWVYCIDMRGHVYAGYPIHKKFLAGCIVAALAPVLLPLIVAAFFFMTGRWSD